MNHQRGLERRQLLNSRVTLLETGTHAARQAPPASAALAAALASASCFWSPLGTWPCRRLRLRLRLGRFDNPSAPATRPPSSRPATRPPSPPQRQLGERRALQRRLLAPSSDEARSVLDGLERAAALDRVDHPVGVDERAAGRRRKLGLIN